MRPHVSAEAMARYRQGDLNQRRTSHIGTHLAGCERCSALNEDLGGVTTLLAGVHPPPMPEDLTARITSAIAAESARRTAAPAAGKAPVTGTTPVARQHRSPRRSRLPRVAPKVALGGLAAAAAVVVLVGGGIYKVVTQTGSTASTSASGVPSAAEPATRSPANGPMASALPVSGPALQYQRSGRRDSITPITTTANFTPAGLSSQVTAEVRKYGAGFTKTGPNAQQSGRYGAASPAAVPGEQTPAFADIPLASLRGCVNRIAAGSLVLLVDVAHYRGAAATIIVTEAAKTGPMQIWVVGTGCSASSSDVLQRATATTP
jgi:hypothetical protein